tara:strand:- start:2151 stop:2906 length:756 start_codon:yes stop_codon:yes gene_type:complete
MIREKLIFKVPIEVPETFHPSDLAGGKLYIHADTATPSSTSSSIGVARSFDMYTATRQPVVGVDRLIFDGVDDYQIVSESAPFGSDSEGIVFFSGYFTQDTSGAVRIFNYNDGNVNYRTFNIQIKNTTGELLFVQDAGTSTTGSSANRIDGNNSLVDGDYYYGYVKGNGIGNPCTMSMNSVTLTKTVALGVDNSLWFDGIPSVDNMAIGGWIRVSPAYGKGELNKIYINSTNLTASEINDMNTFMSDPTNY